MLTIRSFEDGLHSPLKFESCKKDPRTSFKHAMARTKKHAKTLKVLQSANTPGAVLTTSIVAMVSASPLISEDLHRVNAELCSLKVAVN